MNIKKIHIPEAFEQSTTMKYKGNRTMDTYEKNGDVYSKILIKRNHDSENKPLIQQPELKMMSVIEME